MPRWLGLLLLVAAPAASAEPAAPADLAAVAAGVPACDAARSHCFAIQLHVTVVDGAPIAAADWLAGELAEANRLFAAIDVGWQIAGVDALPASAARVANPDERASFAPLVRGPVIDVFVTGELVDVDAPGKTIRGVTLRHGATKYVILSTAAPPQVLAHELGHVFGLPHSSYPISLMNKTPRADPPLEQRTFAGEELAIMRRTLARLVGDRVLVSLPRPAPSQR
jgi:hypothetical protein